MKGIYDAEAWYLVHRELPNLGVELTLRYERVNG